MAIILASQSPRRRELLAQMGLTDFIIRPAQGEEILDPSLTPDRLVEELSRQKAAEVAATAGPEDVIIAADTVVAVGNRVLGKPHSHREAEEMLTALSGRTHTVYTGITVCRGDCSVTQHEATPVHFRTLTPEEISAYVSTGEPMDKTSGRIWDTHNGHQPEWHDKAGGYAIQGMAAKFVKGIEGDYYNVVGLPICRLYLMLKELGIEV